MSTIVRAIYTVFQWHIQKQQIDEFILLFYSLYETSPVLLMDAIHYYDEQKNTLLHYSCYFNCPEIVSILLRHKCSKHRRNKSGYTALHLCLKAGNYKVEKIMINERKKYVSIEYLKR
jgi:ankyrin repeat protein